MQADILFLKLPESGDPPPNEQNVYGFLPHLTACWQILCILRDGMP
jgi:hypothetical protein